MPNKKRDIKIEESNEISYETKTLITVITLVTVYPVGLVLMFIWMKWKGWIKFLVILPAILTIIIPLFVLLAVGMAVIRGGREFINSGEFREMRQGMMNRYIEEVRPTEMEISPTIKIIPLNFK